MSDIVTGKDADFSEERLVARYNGDLANSLGNLVSRTLEMVRKYRSGRIVHNNYDEKLLESTRRSFDPVLLSYYQHCFTGAVFGSRYDVSSALQLLFGGKAEGEDEGELAKTFDGLGIVHANRLIEKTAPWKLAKSAELTDRLDAILYHFTESLRIIAILISPVLPRAAHGIFDQLNWKMDLSGKEQRFRLEDAKWGGLPDEHVIGKPVPLFPRIETN
jgi:methionyl-tRNA synthetase